MSPKSGNRFWDIDMRENNRAFPMTPEKLEMLWLVLVNPLQGGDSLTGHRHIIPRN